MGSVLVVDDEPVILKIVSEVLDELDVKTRVAPDAESALRYIAAEKPDVVLTDVRLPGMDGVELAGRIKSMNGNSSTPVLLMSAYGEPASHKGDAFLRKPFDIDELIGLIERYID
jgi:CheY-like chemotaxis protein